MTLLLGLLFPSLRGPTAPLDGLAEPSLAAVQVGTGLTTAPFRQTPAHLFHAPTPRLLT
jgi:hypothetical protein